MQINQNQVHNYLHVSADKCLEIFEKTMELKGFSQRHGVFYVKLSDLVEIQYFYADQTLKSTTIVNSAKRLINESDVMSKMAAEVVFDTPIDVWEIVEGRWLCPACGSKRFESSCEECRKRYNLPESAFRIRMIADDRYPMWSLGYALEILPIPIHGIEYRLVRVRMDGYQNPDLVYLKNIKVVDDNE